jgi:hypothetical protein
LRGISCLSMRQCLIRIHRDIYHRFRKGTPFKRIVPTAKVLQLPFRHHVTGRVIEISHWRSSRLGQHPKRGSRMLQQRRW